MSVDYRAVVADAPELALALAYALSPSGKPADGVRTSARRDVLNVVALDDLRRLLLELSESVRFWRIEFAEYGIPTEDVPAVLPLVAGDELAAAKAVEPLTAWLLKHWADMDGHPLFVWWCRSLDDWLVPRVKRLRRTGQGQRPRRCVRCGALAVWADLVHGSGVCELCGLVHRARVWVSLREAARALGVGYSSVARWVREGRVESVKRGRVVCVELGECREYKQLVEARRVLNLRG